MTEQLPHMKHAYEYATKSEKGNASIIARIRVSDRSLGLVPPSLTSDFASYWDSHTVVALDSTLTCLLLHDYDELGLSFTSIAIVHAWTRDAATRIS
jgi:hypothetical protein